MATRRILPWMLASVLLGVPAHAAVDVQPGADGAFYTGLLVNGSAQTRFDIVIMGDGFTASEQGLFNTKAAEVVTTLRAREPFASNLCALNVWRVNVVSAESGIDHPEDGIYKDTALDCRYGNPSVDPWDPERLITCTSPAKCYEAAAYAPGYDTVLVLVNDPMFGGGGGSPVTTAIYDQFANTLTHELGHNIGDLADEYMCRLCDGSDANSTFTDPEPTEPNVTTVSDRAQTKWAHLIAPTTPIPTTVDNPPGVVGLWEGAKYTAKGIYRPQDVCHMLDTAYPFCAVCDAAITTRLGSRCTLCDRPGLPPTLAFLCLNLGRLRDIPHWTSPLVVRFPFPPPCQECSPDGLFDDVVLVFDDLPVPGFGLRVLDSLGQVLAEGGGDDAAALEVRFRVPRWEQTFVELTTPAPTAATLVLHPRFQRNGRTEALPGYGP